MLVPMIGAIVEKDANILMFLVMITMNVLMTLAILLLDAITQTYPMMITTLALKMAVIVPLDHIIMK
jgi:hypothetical protein